MIFQSTLSLRRATSTFRIWRSWTETFQSTLSLRRATHLGLTSDTPDRFQSTLSLRRATPPTRTRGCLRRFQSTLSLRRATPTLRPGKSPVRNFNPRSPCGERPGAGAAPFSPRDFNPRSPCGERLSNFSSVQWPGSISIHALLAESDLRPPQRPRKRQPISIHALLAESDWGYFGHTHTPYNFNPRSPCGERPVRMQLFVVADNFNPRSPCGERRLILIDCVGTTGFQSTLSLRRATKLRR